jgi:hypothetical protein
MSTTTPTIRSTAPLRELPQRLRVWASESERGDVPVAALWLVAEPLLTGLFTSAVSSVGG